MVKPVLFLFLSVVLQGVCGQSVDRNRDRFNYRSTDSDKFDFGPEQWDRVRCPDLDKCDGWPDDWTLGKGWELEANTCKWCPEESLKSQVCGDHHQSPINLERNRGVIGHPAENECIDLHWMKYEDSTCVFNHLVAENAFSIERHALKITQPLQTNPTNGEVDIGCQYRGRRWGRIDFSKGFSDWWFLSHIDFKVPSEHTQEGKRYSAEVQMAHFYSVTGEQAGVDNEMAHVSIFLEAYDDAPPYRTLDRVICQWRRVEEETRRECGLPSVGHYPGCLNAKRNHTAFPSEAPLNTPSVSPLSVPSGTAQTAPATNSRVDASAASTKPPSNEADTDVPVAVGVSGASDSSGPAGRKSRRLRSSVHDIIRNNWKAENSSKKRRIRLDPINFREPDYTDEEWQEWIEAYSAHSNGKASQQQRKLLGGSELTWHNYQFLIDSKTEYYYRYSGTQTVPPCYGPFTPQSRGNTNHWRVMKDPIRVHPRQIAEMERLIRERIAPLGTRRQCKPDTAAKVNKNTGKVSVARPLQYHHFTHFKTFCECKDWKSKWPEDQAWCELDRPDVLATYSRFYDQPYNFLTDGF